MLGISICLTVFPSHHTNYVTSSVQSHGQNACWQCKTDNYIQDAISQRKTLWVFEVVSFSRGRWRGGQVKKYVHLSWIHDGCLQLSLRLMWEQSVTRFSPMCIQRLWKKNQETCKEMVVPASTDHSPPISHSGRLALAKWMNEILTWSFPSATCEFVSENPLPTYPREAVGLTFRHLHEKPMKLWG